MKQIVDNKYLESLLEKPLWQLTAKDFFELAQYVNSKAGGAPVTNEVIRISGVRALSEYIGCCESTIYMLRRNGVLDDAIISKIGKKIVFDGEKARELASSFQQEQRAGRRTTD